ncbi:kelch-like protein 32 isoform X2 [Sus scrofa]|uniref:kelch-like protein 32 isoform X2 n=1 Tax=Sus scrofa TaxID=9823 RepID=UPI000A2B8044|nr:kelch-like protein 32 isoform X2 [Sus scrofa]XP_020928901.1 kelch-like protein 32 isoform X2 [Sus scrofa]XP_020928907.1 kelch-like protein 32 isoform X2 [Sus scrofa]XP_020928911.1 kelch-like protein 32 isoform X2 [Sus scrofa]
MPSERFLSIQEMLTGQRLCHSESHNDSVLAALNQQRSDGILCDVTLIAEEQKFHAHKAVLAACSDYFRVFTEHLLYSKMFVFDVAKDTENITTAASASEFLWRSQLKQYGPKPPSYIMLLDCPWPRSWETKMLLSGRIFQRPRDHLPETKGKAWTSLWAMFSLCMVESGADEVNLHGVTSLGLKQALEFAYTGQILLEPGVIQDVLAAGSHLQLLELLNLCSHYLIQELNSFNYLDLYRLADLFNLTLLEKAVIDFLVKHLSELLKSRPEDILTLPYCLLQEVLKSDRLTSLSEEQIWQLAVRWLEHSCHYQYMDELLQYIRFGLMDVDTLHTVALSHPLVQASETATALVNEALEYHQSIYAQPVWQTRRTKPRFQSDTLYIIGGKKREVCKVKELRYFNPVDQENALIAAIANWSELAPMPVGRSHHCVAVMGDFLFVAGGEVEHASGRTCAVRTACRYDPRSNSWAEIAPMKNCREHFVLGAVDEYLYAVGGRNELRQVLPTVERYCPKKNKWTFVQSFDRSLSCHAGYVADGLLWISGGVTNTAQYQNRLMVYEPNQNKWISRSPMLQRRVYHSMAAVQRKLYVLGGNDLDYNNDRILVRHIDSYNIDTDQWTRCNFNLLTGQNESGVAVHNERIYLVGGYSIWTNEPLACIQVLDVSREGKEEVFYGPTLPFASNGIAACFLPAPYFTCPNLQTLQVPHHRIGTI